MTSSSRRPQVSDYSYSGANTLLRRPSDFNVGSGGGSLALLLRHKNCPADGRQFVGAERMTPRARPFHQVQFYDVINFFTSLTLGFNFSLKISIM